MNPLDMNEEELKTYNTYKTESEKKSFMEGKIAAQEIWGNRIKSSNIPRGGKVAQKFASLKKEMHKLTGTKPSGFNSYNAVNNAMNTLYQNQNYKSYMPPYTPNNPEPAKDHSLVVFYGFNGMLPFKYSVVRGMSMEQITARMDFAKNKVSYKVMYMEEFKAILKLMTEPLIETQFDDAMNIIRIGLQKAEEEFEDAEEDEFDDNCIESCQPGNHKCGKK